MPPPPSLGWGRHFVVCSATQVTISSANCFFTIQLRWPASLISTTGQSLRTVRSGDT